LELAVELLDQTRAVLWAQLLDTRTDLTALRQVRPDLADELGLAGADLNGRATVDAGDDELGWTRDTLRWRRTTATGKGLAGRPAAGRGAPMG
jgi:hypothetical protein